MEHLCALPDFPLFRPPILSPALSWILEHAERPTYHQSQSVCIHARVIPSSCSARRERQPVRRRHRLSPPCLLIHHVEKSSAPSTIILSKEPLRRCAGDVAADPKSKHRMPPGLTGQSPWWRSYAATKGEASRCQRLSLGTLSGACDHSPCSPTSRTCHCAGCLCFV